MESWVSVGFKKPPENILVETKIDDIKGVRNEAKLARRGNLYFVEDRTMYVYYMPTHWKHIN